MKFHSNKRKASELSPRCSSPYTITSHSGFHRSPAATSTQIKSKRKQSYDNGNSSLVLLSNVKKLGQETRKRMKRESSRNSQNFNWHVSPIQDTSTDEMESFEDLDKSLNCTNDISAIYNDNVMDDFCSDAEYHSNDVTGGFAHRKEKAEFSSDTDTNESDSRYLQDLKEKFRPQIRPPCKKRKLNEKSRPTEPIKFYFKNSMLILMNHPMLTTLNGYVSIEVLSGSVSMCGHELNPHKDPIKIFSSKTTGFVKLKTESCDEPWLNRESMQILNHKLERLIGIKKSARRILNKFENTTVVVVIRDCILPHNLQFVELYYPEVFEFRLTTQFLRDLYGEAFLHIKKRKMVCLPTNENTMQFNHDAEDLAIDIIKAIRNSKLHTADGPRVLVFGPKNSGKSSLIRYLMNRTLSKYRVVYYLDTDPGQSEFTPPGVVSLTKVTNAVIGPSFCHQRKPVHMSFTGGVSADSSPIMYHKSIDKLFHKFMKCFNGDPLFVNTMGWMKGLGLEVLKEVIKTVKPTIIVDVVSENEDSMFDYREYLPEKPKFYQICSPFSETKEKSDRNPAKKERELSLLSYFGRLQPSLKPPTYLNCFKPLCVPWDKIAIYSFGKKVATYRLIESLNTAVVALCRVKESLVLESTHPSTPHTLVDEPDNECIGFGIVRAIDEGKRLLYIVTPVTLDEMKNVNAIIKGNITIPKSLILNQPILGAELPFTDEREIELPQNKSECGSEDGDFADIGEVSN